MVVAFDRIPRRYSPKMNEIYEFDRDLRETDRQAISIITPQIFREDIDLFLIRPTNSRYQKLEIAGTGEPESLQRTIELFEIGAREDNTFRIFPKKPLDFHIRTIQIGIPLEENYMSAASFELTANPYYLRRWKNPKPVRVHFIENIVAAQQIADEEIKCKNSEMLFLWLKRALESQKYEIAAQFRDVLVKSGFNQETIAHVSRPGEVNPLFNYKNQVIA